MRKHVTTSISVMPGDVANLNDVTDFLKDRGVDASRSSAIRYALAETARTIRISHATDRRGL